MRHLVSSLHILGAIFAAWLAVTTLVSAQQLQSTEPPAPAATPSPERSGLLDDIGKLFKAPADLLAKPDAPMQEALPETPPASTTAAPAAAPTRFFPGMVMGREPCPRAANGAPDCQAGSDRLCQSKGYKGGKSLNTDSAFSCSARQARGDGGKLCGNEHFVTSAFCN